MCPDQNTCCVLARNNNWGASLAQVLANSGCLPNDMPGPTGVCCDDLTGTGCAPDYGCESSTQNEGSRANGRRLFCKRGPDAKDDPLVEVMPRYVLCSPPPGTLSKIYGLPVDRANNGMDQQREGSEKATTAALAYYSTHGDILDPNPNFVRAAVVVIHGMGRNADDYFCSVTAAVSMQTFYDPSSVIVIAPRFLDPSDGEVKLTSNNIPMRWGGDGDEFGAWRYGADASFPPSAVGVSSFDAFDQLVKILEDRNHFPNLERISVAGHSSGGQFVQRWALLSDSSLWEHDQYQPSLRAVGSAKLPMLRAIVSNPSSYAYLDGRRFVDGRFETPSAGKIASCPSYNEWEWGLEPGGRMLAPYKDRAIQNIGGATKLAERFATRDVVYLSGGQDRCNVTGLDRTGWCYSHGLETTCGDMMEGRQRLERSMWYYHSLTEFFGRHVHCHAIVEGVGHDHSLMWESSIGLSALFGNNSCITSTHEGVVE